DMGGAGYGTGLDSPTPVFTYTLPGTYQVVVTVTNACGVGTASTTVEVVPEHRIFLPIVWRRPVG
ncbi:MAG: PKD domain-containing protein, partial [Chloroflexia bacterium]